MGHWNIHNVGHATDLDPHQQCHSHLHPEPCFFYWDSVVTAPGNLCSFNFHPMPEHIHSASFYGTPPYSVVPPQFPVMNLDLSDAALAAYFNNQCIAHLQNISYIDDVQSFKKKNSDEAHMSYHFSVPPLAATPVEHDISHSQVYYVVPPLQLPGNPWLDMHFGATNGRVGPFAWSLPPNSCYVHGVFGYLVTDINGTQAGFLHPPIVHFHSNFCNPIQPGAAPTFLASTNFWLYRPHRREIILGPNARQHDFPHLSILPEDEVAILEIPGYHEAGDSVDQHRDMRLDIEHMSYEELLALGEHIGSVGTGLKEDFIQTNLKIQTFTSSLTCPKIDFCVICQADYEYGEDIGRTECGHEYHGECIKRWLLVKNTCPICKSTALSSKRMGLLQTR